MEELKQKLEQFFKENSPAIIVNTLTDKALLCLNPEFEIQDDKIFMKFESLNERDGNNVFFKALQGYEEGTLYLENEEENVLMLQGITVGNYNHYIKPQYFNAPELTDLEKIKANINSQEGDAW